MRREKLNKLETIIKMIIYQLFKTCISNDYEAALYIIDILNEENDISIIYSRRHIIYLFGSKLVSPIFYSSSFIIYIAPSLGIDASSLVVVVVVSEV